VTNHSFSFTSATEIQRQSGLTKWHRKKGFFFSKYFQFFPVRTMPPVALHSSSHIRCSLQTDKAWEPAKKQRSFRKQGHYVKKNCSIIYNSSHLKNVEHYPGWIFYVSLQLRVLKDVLGATEICTQQQHKATASQPVTGTYRHLTSV
jgi:hypothetical protein